MTSVRDSKYRQKADAARNRANSGGGWTAIDAIGQIAQTRILSSYCVDALRGRRLRGVLANFAEPIYTSSTYCVDLTRETHTPSGLPDELPTDWVKSD